MALSATRSVNFARASAEASTTGWAAIRVSRASSTRPAVTRLWTRQARCRERRTSDMPGRASGQRLVQSGVGEVNRLVAVPRDVQRDGRQPDDLTTSGMLRRRDLEGAPAE